MGVPFSERKLVRVALVASLLLVIFHLYNSSFYDRIYSQKTASAPPSTPDEIVSEEITCKPEPGLEDVLVILKTGATETASKLPVHFGTTLQCVPHWVVFSDFGEQVAGQEIHDTLDQVADEVKQNSPDFELYNRMQQDGRAALDPAQLAAWSKAANTESGTQGNPAWKLDKWKFLPLVDKALERSPHAKWYIFAEADTYISWRAMVEWLAHFDPSEPIYLGNQMQIGDVIFGYGGAGWVVSAPAMRMVSEQRAAHLAEYDLYTAHHWAGDCVLGKVFSDAGVPLTWSWPNLVGGFAEIDYTWEQYGKRLWCHKAVSHHHVTPQDVQEMWEFEQVWYRKDSPLLRHKDVFEHYVMPRLREQRDGWDNLSGTPLNNQTVDSFETCGQACQSQPDCLQYLYSGDECLVSNVTYLGQQSQDESKSSQSGWLLRRIENLVQDLDDCNGYDGWVLP